MSLYSLVENKKEYQSTDWVYISIEAPGDTYLIPSTIKFFMTEVHIV